MKLRMFALWLAWAALVYGTTLVGAADDKDEKKGVTVKIAGLTSTSPAAWKEEKPSGTMRLQQFLLPKVDGDDTDAEVTLYKAGGGVKANIDRWKNQFDLKGKKETDVVKEQQMKVSDVEVAYLDVTGTYKAPPFDPKYKGKKMENFRLIGVIFDTKDGEYQIRLIGPAKTVEKHKKGFDEFVKAFK